MTIFVVNKKEYNGQGISMYIGRPSTLGNPFTHLEEKTLACYKVKTREEAVENYREYFYAMLGTEYKFKLAIDWIEEKSKKGDVHLVCWCAPLPCHGDIIKEYLDSKNP